MPSKHKRDFSCYLTQEVFNLLEDTCLKTGHKRSALIEDILRLYFKLPPA